MSVAFLILISDKRKGRFALVIVTNFENMWLRSQHSEVIDMYNITLTDSNMTITKLYRWFATNYNLFKKCYIIYKQLH